MTTMHIKNFRVDFLDEFEGKEIDEAMNMAEALILYHTKDGVFPHPCGMDNGLYTDKGVFKAPSIKIKGHHGEIIDVTRA